MNMGDVHDDKRQQERVLTDGMWQEPVMAEENRKLLGPYPSTRLPPNCSISNF
jgi:hypothetical protein